MTRTHHNHDVTLYMVKIRMNRRSPLASTRLVLQLEVHIVDIDDEDIRVLDDDEVIYPIERERTYSIYAIYEA